MQHITTSMSMAAKILWLEELCIVMSFQSSEHVLQNYGRFANAKPGRNREMQKNYHSIIILRVSHLCHTCYRLLSCWGIRSHNLQELKMVMYYKANINGHTFPPPCQEEPSNTPGLSACRPSSFNHANLGWLMRRSESWATEDMLRRARESVRGKRNREEWKIHNPLFSILQLGAGTWKLVVPRELEIDR